MNTELPPDLNDMPPDAPVSGDLIPAGPIPCDVALEQFVRDAQERISLVRIAPGKASKVAVQLDVLRSLVEKLEGLLKVAVKEDGERIEFEGRIWGPVPVKARAKVNKLAMKAAGKLNEYNRLLKETKEIEAAFTTRGDPGERWCWHKPKATEEESEGDVDE